MSERVPLADPRLGDGELAEVAQVLQSGQLTLGATLQRFETAIAEICDTRHAVGCANGTAALHLALLALDIGPGDEVIVPAYTFPATSNAVILCGATPVFCDVASGIDVATADEIAKVVTARTKAIMVVHLFGYPVEMQPVLDLAKQHSLSIIEDAAGALGTLVQGRLAGSWGDVGCFSFHPRKIITTGEGGAVVMNDDGLAERVRRLRHHGIGPDGFSEVGLNYRLSDILAAVALPQLAQLESIVARRNELALTYDAALRAMPGISPAPACGPRGNRHVYQAYVARLDDASTRASWITMLSEAGIESQVGTYCVPGLKPYRQLGFDTEGVPNAVDAAEVGLAIPLYPTLTDKSQAAVVAALGQCAHRLSTVSSTTQ